MQVCRSQTRCKRKTCNLACPYCNAIDYALSKAEIFKVTEPYKLSFEQSQAILQGIGNDKEAFRRFDCGNFTDQQLLVQYIASVVCATHHDKSVSRLRCARLDFNAMMLDNSNQYSFSENIARLLRDADILIVNYTLGGWSYYHYVQLFNILTGRSLKKTILVGENISLKSLNQTYQSTYAAAANLAGFIEHIPACSQKYVEERIFERRANQK